MQSWRTLAMSGADFKLVCPPFNFKWSRSPGIRHLIFFTRFPLDTCRYCARTRGDTRRSVDREVRRVDVNDHPAFHVWAHAGEVPAAAYRWRPSHSRVLAPRRTSHVPARGFEAASPGTAGIRAEHPECGDAAQRQARRDESARWKRRRER